MSALALIAAAIVAPAIASAGPADPQSRVVAAVEAGHRCPGSLAVVVRAGAAADAQAACDGSRRALAFLGQAGLSAPTLTTVNIVEELPGDMHGQAVGCFERDTRQIFLLSYAAFEATGTWMRVPVDRELYRSAAAHEMAHAVVGCNSESITLPVPAHEYVAYVAMFATMAPGLRDQVLARFAGHGFGNSLQINIIVYLVDPLQFAADAWRHYLKRRDRMAWLRDIVAGRVVQEFPTDGP